MQKGEFTSETSTKVAGNYILMFTLYSEFCVAIS